MRLVIARCSVDYEGRLSAHLPSAMRLLLCKVDGSISIHADGSGGYKPLNWMLPPCQVDEQPDRWVVRGNKGEVLTIAIEEVVSDMTYDLGSEPGLQKDGVESELQRLLAAARDIGWVEVDYDRLRGIEPLLPTLFSL